ncbi:MAG TPA: TIGR00725 family protein [Solirubrobacteraceae bacterium]
MADSPHPFYVAVVGADGEVRAQLIAEAELVGTELARRGAVVVTGGLGGVMEAACRGARCAGGVTLGILPGDDRRAANRWVSVAIATGMGELRNGLVVWACDAVIAVAGEYGTLSEIALALKAGKPVVGIATWEIPGVQSAPDAGVAVDMAIGPRGAR